MSTEQSAKGVADIDCQKKRDLELVLLGAALVKGASRERVMELMPRDSMFGEIGRIINAIRDLDSVPIKEWMAQQGCGWEQGDDFILSIASAITEYNQRTMLSMILSSLSQKVRHGTKKEVLDQIAALSDVASSIRER